VEQTTWEESGGRAWDEEAEDLADTQVAMMIWSEWSSEFICCIHLFPQSVVGLKFSSADVVDGDQGGIVWAGV
jgi:hypothetical protein